MKFYEEEKLSAVEAKFEAQRIAFAPFVFQAAVALRDLGILKAIEQYGKEGAQLSQLEKELDLSRYGIKVLVESGLGSGLLLYKDKKYSLSNVGFFILNDAMTEVNMKFVQDVNYQGLFHLKEAIKTGKPAGLKSFGAWPTIYEGLASLPEEVQKSWFDFDHFYSDGAFKYALAEVFKERPKRILDIGGNTGKFALCCLQFDADVQITIADLPGQLRMAEKKLGEKGFQNRLDYYAIDLLTPEQKLPTGHDVIWMSQFLDCFSEEQIVAILKRVAEVMEEESRLYILETFWDRQKHEAASFCLQQTSLYFSCIANGNSQMYHSEDMLACLADAGLKVLEDVDDVGMSHTLFKCKKKKE